MPDEAGESTVRTYTKPYQIWWDALMTAAAKPPIVTEVECSYCSSLHRSRTSARCSICRTRSRETPRAEPTCVKVMGAPSRSPNRIWMISASRGGRSATFLRRISERRRSEEHTSELQSRPHLVCRLLLEKK